MVFFCALQYPANECRVIYYSHSLQLLQSAEISLIWIILNVQTSIKIYNTNVFDLNFNSIVETKLRAPECPYLPQVRKTLIKTLAKANSEPTSSPNNDVAVTVTAESVAGLCESQTRHILGLVPVLKDTQALVERAASIQRPEADVVFATRHDTVSVQGVKLCRHHSVYWALKMYVKINKDKTIYILLLHMMSRTV